MFALSVNGLTNMINKTPKKAKYTLWVLVDSKGRMTSINQLNEFGKPVSPLASIYFSEKEAKDSVKNVDRINKKLKLPKLILTAIPAKFEYDIFKP